MAEEKDKNQIEEKAEETNKSSEATDVEKENKEKEADPDQKEENNQVVPDKDKDTSPKIDPQAIKPGMTVRVHQKIKDVNAKGQEKERIQVFEGVVLAKRGKTLDNCRILVRKIASNHVGVEKIFPLASPTIVKIEIVKQAKVRRAKLYFLRSYRKRLREKRFV